MTAKVVGDGPASACAVLASSWTGGSAICGALADDAVADWTGTGDWLLEPDGVGAGDACVDSAWG
jgi:hypothetical protein